MAQASINHKAANLWVSRIIPLILIGIVAYVSWVVIVHLCVHYLLRSTIHNHAPRRGAAIAILVLYAILVLLMGFAYFRLLYTVTFNPGYVPQGLRVQAKSSNKTKIKSRHRKSLESSNRNGTLEKVGIDGANDATTGRFTGGDYADGAYNAPTTTEAAPGLQEFYSKDVFVCQGDGRPIWCSTCENWKPDRSHHCREIERCVKKMDHFCPWVGGVVSETSFKFFIQFLAWTAIYCIFNLIIMAYFVREYKKETHTIDVHWLVTLCLGALFGLFTTGMTGSSLQFVILNSSTIENLSRKNVVWTLAVYMPKPPEVSPGFRTISYSSGTNSSNGQTTPEQPNNTIRTFAILHSKPGENPFDLGPFRNFKSVMGDRWYDWVVSIKYSPCCDHNRSDGQFAMGPVVQRMRKEAGISPPLTSDEEKPHRKHRRRRRRRRRPVEERHRASHDEHVEYRTEKMHVPQEHHQNRDTGHDRDEIDLESGLAHTNGSVH